MKRENMPSIALVMAQESQAQKDKLLALFDQLDERGKITTLALLETAVKLHPKEKAL